MASNKPDSDPFGGNGASPMSVLEDIPYDIYRIIHLHLSRLSKISLAATCRHFRKLQDNAPTSSQDCWLMQQDPSSLSRQITCWPVSEEYLELLCMGERQQEPRFGSRKVCSSCLRTHPNELFSDDQLANRAQERVCIGMKGAVKASLSLDLRFKAIPW